MTLEEDAHIHSGAQPARCGAAWKQRTTALPELISPSSYFCVQEWANSLLSDLQHSPHDLLLGMNFINDQDITSTSCLWHL